MEQDTKLRTSGVQMQPTSPERQYTDYLSHEPGDDDFVEDIDAAFQMIHDEIDRIYRENGDLHV